MIREQKIFQKTQDYRREYRLLNPLSRNMRIFHVLVVILLTFFSIFFAGINIHDLNPHELLTIPVIFILGNFIIYFLHRFVLHQRIPFFDYGYKKHTLMHHHYFTDQLYGFDSLLDLDVIMFPFWFVFLLSLVVAPILGLIALILFTKNVSLLTVIMVNVNFLAYELVHYCSHLDADSWIHRIALFRFMRNHHRLHHEMTLMSEKNFDIIVPFFDPLFKTLQKRKIE